jgi:hypothetical protein
MNKAQRDRFRRKRDLERTDADGSSDWRQHLFPNEERRIPGERAHRTILRTVHLASVSVLVGGHFFDIPLDRLYGPLAWTVGSGVLFVLLEMYGTLDWVFQVRGLVTLAKTFLLLLIPLFWEQRIWILMTVLAIGSISSHMPGRFRYYSVLSRDRGEFKRG